MPMDVCNSTTLDTVMMYFILIWRLLEYLHFSLYWSTSSHYRWVTPNAHIQSVLFICDFFYLQGAESSPALLICDSISLSENSVCQCTQGEGWWEASGERPLEGWAEAGQGKEPKAGRGAGQVEQPFPHCWNLKPCWASNLQCTEGYPAWSRKHQMLEKLMSPLCHPAP